MTTTAFDASGSAAGGLLPHRRSLTDLGRRARRRKRVDRGMSVLLTLAMAVAVIPLGLILYKVAQEGYGVINLTFFREDQVPFNREGGGFRNGFVGTALIMGLAISMAVPLGIGAALYLVEYGRGKTAALVRFFTDVMTGVPSIFVGLFVYAVLVIGTAQMGFGTFVGAVAIAIMMLPIVVRASEEMLKMVPNALRNASSGLGARRWQTATRVVLPASAPGLVTSSMLAIARGVGETAPLMLTAFGSLSMVTELTGQRQSAVTLLIYDHAKQPAAEGIARAWGGALSLLVITVVITIGARIIGNRLATRDAR